MYFPGEALDIPVLSDDPRLAVAGAGRHFSTVTGWPDLIARNPSLIRSSSVDRPVGGDFASALLYLSENYGIEFPAIGSLAVRTQNPAGPEVIGQAFTTIHFVDGYNMHSQMKDVPFDVTCQTVDKILSYYEDMSRDFSSRLYLADLRLRHCIYGYTTGDGSPKDDTPKVNFVDYDPRLGNLTRTFLNPEAYFGNGFGGFAGIDDDLEALRRNYPDSNFDEIASRLLCTAKRLGIAHKVPRAYEHAEVNQTLNQQTKRI